LRLPFLFWDGSGYSIDPTRKVGLTGEVPAQDCSHQVQRQNYKKTDAAHCNLIKQIRYMTIQQMQQVLYQSNSCFKGLVNPKMKILQSITHPHVPIP